MRVAVREAIEAVVLAIFLYLLLQSTVVNYQVQGSSMEPQLENTERLLVSKVVYTSVDMRRLSRFLPWVDREEEWFPFHPPQRGDIIVFRFPKDPSENFVKRVIGVPGERVAIIDGVVLINDEPLDEPYITNVKRELRPPVLVGEHEYYVLGDNRPHSDDSRNWGMVPEENIIGKAWIGYWPLKRFGPLLPLWDW